MNSNELTDSPVKQRREELGLTQFELAVRAGLTTTTISNIETGRYQSIRLSPAQFKGICNALGWEKISDIPDDWFPSQQKSDAN
jgi:putative transcriptional regulator